MKKQNYRKCYDKLTEDERSLLEDKHFEIRERYLMYIVTGVNHSNSVENALFDVFEGDDDVQEQFPNIQENKNIINFCYIAVNFSSFEEMEDILNDSTVQLNM